MGTKRDLEVEWRNRIAADEQLQAVLRRLGPTLRDVHTPPTTGLMKARPPAWRFGELYQLLGRCGLLADVEMPRLSEIVGDPATADAFVLKLTPPMVVRAWLAMRVNPLPPGVRQPAPTSGAAVVLSAMPFAKWMVHTKSAAEKGGGDFINGGGLRLDEDGGGCTYDEWLEILIRVGEARYCNVRCGLPPDHSSPPTAVCAEAVLAHIAGLRSEQGSLQEASRIPFPRIAATQMTREPGESPDDFERWKWIWKQLCSELDRVHLWPSWEPQAFKMMRTGFPRLASMFSYYVKADWISTDTELSVTLSPAAWADFVADCGFTSAEFDEERLHELYAAEMARVGGQLHVVQFVALLINIAFLRVHPNYQPGDLDKPGMRPVPECVEGLLRNYIFPRAPCDPSIERALQCRAARNVQGTLALYKQPLRKLYQKLGGELIAKSKRAAAPPAEEASEVKGGDKAAGGGVLGVLSGALAGGMGGGGGAAQEEEEQEPGAPEKGDGLGADEYLQLVEASCDNWAFMTLTQRSEITGEPAMRTAWSVGLSAQQAMAAYRDSRSVAEWWTHRLSFDGFVQALCRCGEAMFSAVNVMTANEKVDGMIKLVLRTADRATVVDQATYVQAPPRFDPVVHVAQQTADGDAKGQYTGSSAVPIGRWLDCWARMELRGLHGYPRWDQPLYMLLQPYFATLSRLFAAYAAPAPRSEADLSPPPLEIWATSLEMMPEQWAMLITDMGLLPAAQHAESAHPAQAALMGAFERQPVDGPGHGSSNLGPSQALTQAPSQAPRPGTPDVDEGGGRGIPQFISALLAAAFIDANPAYEEAAVAGDIDLDRLVPVPESASLLLEHRVPLTLMRRCHTRLRHEVDLTKALLNDKQAKLQQARTRERNHAIEAAGALKRQGNNPREEEDSDERRPLRHQNKIKSKKDDKAQADPAELRADVERKQAIFDDFTRIAKRKQADLVLLQTELEPLLKDMTAHSKEAAVDEPTGAKPTGGAAKESKVEGKGGKEPKAPKDAKGGEGRGKEPKPGEAKASVRVAPVPVAAAEAGGKAAGAKGARGQAAGLQPRK